MTKLATRPITVAAPAEVREVRFGGDMERRIDEILARYPNKGAALLPVLWLCQERWGWLSAGVMEAVGGRLDLSPAFVEGVASFYTMFHLEPPGRHVLQLCTTLSCQLCGAAELVEHLKQRLDIDFGETTPDGAFTLVNVQCLGACGEAPVIQINDDYYTDLSPDALDDILDRLASDD
jgi:NADH-quinone oxidoreductase subunit E